jgi:hypothetical protein
MPACGSLMASVAGAVEVLRTCSYPNGARPPIISPLRRRWTFPRIMRSMILARSNSATAPKIVSVTLFSGLFFQYRQLWNIRAFPLQSALMPANLITLAHFSVSSAISFPN